ncbi:MAG: aromatic hydrocarbon degradation membrane protein [Bacteroidetes bacterium]|nr:MAG: aromatic hydrocarbon degradation membrane protein [Bacteroidota bacterium]
MIYATGLAGLLWSGSLQAQNEIDALRYTQIGFGGTARYCAMGGAFGAIGADMSVLAVNPAGLGMYRRSEFNFTPNFFSRTTSSTYNGTLSDDSRYGMNFNSFGFVFAGKTDNATEDGWQTAGFGIAYNRQQNFQSNMAMRGESNTSMMDSWKVSAGGSSPSQLDGFNEGMAYQVWLLNPIPGDSLHYSDTIPDGDLLLQKKSVETRGGMGEWDFSFGGNYANKLYLGGTIGVPQVRYEETTTYSEQEVNDTTSTFDYLEHRTSLETRGSGVNFKFGFIFRPVDWVRVGGAFHSPTIIRLSDAYNATMISQIGGVVRENSSPSGSFNYSVVTPMRAIGSIAFIIGKQGVVSADYEFVDYSDARLRARPQVFFDQNDAIRLKYTAAGNLRIGAEYRLQPVSLRAGFALYGNPYAAGITNEDTRMSFSGGIGYRDPDDRFYVDGAFVRTMWKENYYFYDDANAVNNESGVTNIMVTVGFRY